MLLLTERRRKRVKLIIAEKSSVKNLKLIIAERKPQEKIQRLKLIIADRKWLL
jgi:hypothetical protein